MCSRAAGSRTVAVTRAPAIVPSCTAAVPTPPAAPCTSSALADHQPGLREERVVGRGEDLGHAARGGPVELLGHRHRRPLVHDRQLRLAAAADHGHDAVARLEALRPAPDRHHLAGQLEARDVGRRARRRRIAALELVHVGAVEPGRAHAHEQLARLRLGVRMLLDRDLAVADGGGAHRADACTPGGIGEALPLSWLGIRPADRGKTLSCNCRIRTFRRSGAKGGSASSGRCCGARTSCAARACRTATGAACCSCPASWRATARWRSMTHWLRNAGYRTKSAGIRANVDCSRRRLPPDRGAPRGARGDAPASASR